MSAAPSRRLPFLAIAGLAVLAVAATAQNLYAPLLHLREGAASAGYDPERMVLLYSTLPRLAISLVCGAALGASGALLQQALRNPLASPTTLGFDAGARLALVVATLFFPALLGIGRDLVAIAGSTVAAGLVFLLTRRQDFAPVPLVLSGLVVSLYCGALAAILTLLNDRWLSSLFIWGAGSLSQQGWSATSDLALRLIVPAVLAVLLIRPLNLLDLGEENARSLGMNVGLLRVLAVALSIMLSAFVTSAVGVIGFVGLVAPILAQLSGARRFGARLLLSSLLGALLLWATDAGVQASAGALADFLPTGAVTAFLGAPLLLLLLPRLKRYARPLSAARTRITDARPQARTLVLFAFALVLLGTLSVLIGRDIHGGWTILSPGEFVDILPWRGPRLVATLCAGAMLALAGALLQRLTGNVLAGPEVLGIGAGATIAVALTLFASASLGGVGQGVASLLGAFAVLAAILSFSHRSGFQPERVILTGIALSSLLDAVVGVLSASGDPRSVQLLAWLAGAPGGIGWDVAGQTFAAAAILSVLSLLLFRWAAMMPLGPLFARALGVPLTPARFLMLLAAASLTAAATPILGPLSFVGLMAPQAARAIGLRRPLPYLCGSLLAGAALAALADFGARAAVFPWQLPTGLIAALVGAPVLLLLLSRREAA
ncbi:Fe(3+)-hydroxamate ABC transporter permease FhuB [Aureimonas psammosilenae]|uniref:Fe(3+)-hydroxamate ABC transporter permease FhuB n=1 Tax=Aureimonas psammosilenae TaxID=2495496 RepID=UPI0012611625|nr:Fe(3+)-hydroxamate ABC transporter permease FhuB [Aureimonas psammosilenae]